MRRAWLTLQLLWLMGLNLRTAIFGIPPVLPELRHDLGLSYSASGALTSIVLATLGLDSVPGAILGARLGAQRTVTVCGIGLGLAAAARLLPPQLFWVFVGTAALTLCVALVQPSIPVLVRRWFPGSVPRVSGVYSNGILVGNTVGASATPLLENLAGWRGTFLVWAGLALMGGLLWARLTPRDDAGATPSRLLESIRDRRVWQILALFTFQNVAYFSAATWLPFLLRGQSPFYVSLVFLCVNLFPLPVLLAVTLLPWNYPLSSSFYVGPAGEARSADPASSSESKPTTIAYTSTTSPNRWRSRSASWTASSSIGSEPTQPRSRNHSRPWRSLLEEVHRDRVRPPDQPPTPPGREGRGAWGRACKSRPLPASASPGRPPRASPRRRAS